MKVFKIANLFVYVHVLVIFTLRIQRLSTFTQSGRIRGIRVIHENST